MKDKDKVGFYMVLEGVDFCGKSTLAKQIVEMLVILFYIWYVLEWFIKLLIYRNAHSAYRNISFGIP